jgi:hypothetical protein
VNSNRACQDRSSRDWLRRKNIGNMSGLSIIDSGGKDPDRSSPADDPGLTKSISGSVDRVRRSLQMEQLGVLTTQGHQLIMAALLNDPPMIKNVDPVGGSYC